LRQKSAPASKPASKAPPAKESAQEAPKKKEASPAPRSSAPSKQASQGTRRFRLSIGKEEGISAAQLRESVIKLTGVPENALGKIDIQSKGSIVEVSSDQAEWTAMKMKRALIAGKRVKAKLM
jgi:hypothetical protein